MERMISIGGKEMRFVANGATPRVYRALFGSDVFLDMKHTMEQVEGNEYKVGDITTIENLAYCLGRQSGEIPKTMSIEDWLATIDDPMGIAKAAGDIVGLWTSNGKTTSSPKTEGGTQTAPSQQAPTS